MIFPHFVVITKNEVKMYIQRELAVSRCIVAAFTALETVSQDTTIRVISGQWWERERFRLCSTREIGLIQKDIMSPLLFYAFSSRLCKKHRKNLFNLSYPNGLFASVAKLQRKITEWNLWIITEVIVTYELRQKHGHNYAILRRCFK
jgi:hypothetical protein